MSEESIEVEASASKNLSADQDVSSGVTEEPNLEITEISKKSANSSASDFMDNEESAENPNPVGNLVDFLKYKGLNDDLKNQLLVDGPTDEMIRILKELGFCDYDFKLLMSLWPKKIQACGCPEDETTRSDVSSADENASSASDYLKHKFHMVLKQALREVLVRKPYDPIEFLGHWLLNFTVCEERARLRKEWENELMIEREKHKVPEMDDDTFEFPEHDEAEDFNEDWNFVHYENA